MYYCEISQKPWVQMHPLHPRQRRLCPAANSKCRTNIENGQDEEVDRTQSDILNGFPSMKMTLLPGGCGFYEIPIKPGEVNAMIQPAKKKREIHWVYKNSRPDREHYCSRFTLIMKSM